MPIDRVVHVVRVRPKRADVARTVFYPLKSPCRGYRAQDGRWSSGEPLFPAGPLDQFRILNRCSMRDNLLFGDKQPGGGVAILNDALKTARARVERVVG